MKQYVLNTMIYVPTLAIPHANLKFVTPLYIDTCNLFVFTTFFYIIP